MRSVFLNLTAHPLLPEQEERARIELGVEEFIRAEDILPIPVVQRLRQSPGDPEALMRLAIAVAEGIKAYAIRNGVHLYVHLPAGSPAFMFIFANLFPTEYATPVFSHSRRDVTEVRLPDGSVQKRSAFRFEKFIVF